MPGVQNPHCSPCSCLKPSWSGCSSLGPDRPSTVSIAWPSACTASIVQDLTGRPSTSTVHAPQFVVSQPMCVPVSPSPRRSRCDSSSRGSTSATVRAPLTVTVIRLTGTPAACSLSAGSCSVVISGRPLRGRLGAAEQPRHERAHHVPLVLGAAPMVGPRLGRLPGQLRGQLDLLRGQRLAGQRLGRRGGGDGG